MRKIVVWMFSAAVCLILLPSPLLAQVIMKGATEGQKYSQPLPLKVDGTMPFSFKADNALPSCLTLSAVGVLEGTPNKSCVGSSSFQVTVTDATGVANNFKLQITIAAAKPPAADAAKPGATAASNLDTSPNVWYRIGAGLDVTAASSSNPSGRLMGDLALQMPLRFSRCPNGPCSNYIARNWFDGYLRVDSISQPGAISGLSNASSYLASATSLSPEQAVYSMESQIGYDFDLFSSSNGSYTRPYITLQAGAITPLSANQSDPTVYELTSAIESTYNSAKANAAYSQACPGGTANGPNQQLSYGAPSNTTECYVAFLPQDRDRFYRYYQAGFRLKHFAYDSEAKRMHYPAVFEAEVGQNDYVTGGSLRGPVGHFGGSTYVPEIHGVYLFGSMDIGFKGAQTYDSVLLTVPSSAVSISGPNVAVLSSPQPNRDRWRLGFSLDLVEIKTEINKRKAQGQ